MKIIVIHGDDTQKSYARLSKFSEVAHERGWEVVYFDSESRNSLPESVSSSTLFGDTRFFIVRDYRLLAAKDLEWIKNKSEKFEGNLIIYASTLLTLAALKKFGKIEKIEEYKLPKFLYEFLDNLGRDDSKKSLKLFNKLIEKEAPEFIFAIVAKQLRDLYWVKNDSNLAYPSWKLGNLKRQATSFENAKLKELISDLSEIDYKVKTGQADLASELDLFFLSKLE